MEFSVPPAVNLGNSSAVTMQWIDADTRAGSFCGDSSKQRHNCSSSNASNTHVEDTSLTSLNWLPDFKIQPMDDSKEDRSTSSLLTKSSASSIHSTDSSSSTGSWNGQESEIEKEECLVPLSPIKRCLSQTAEFEKNPLRFEENPNKPPFSYTTIIYLAIRSCNKEKVMLSDIYQWIKDHFKYYRIAESTWQNSVRHNLSLNQFFRKIPRGEGDPGKGSFWQINPEYEQLLSNDNELQRLVQQQLSNKGPLQRKRSKTKKKGHSSASTSVANSTNSKHHAPFPSFTHHAATQKKHCTKINQQRSMCTPPVAASSLMPPPQTSVDPCHLPGDLDWVTLLGSQKYGCIACHEAEHHCRPMFGSPVLGTTDILMGHIGDPLSCSPAILPVALQNKIQDTPPQKTLLTTSLEEIITTQESPAPLLPPWAAESRPFSPTHFNLEHPWAESNRCQEVGLHKVNRREHHVWSSPHEVMWSSPSINDQANKLQVTQLI